MVTKITEALIFSKPDPGGAAFVPNLEAGINADQLSFSEQGEKQNLDCSNSQVGLNQHRQSIPQCSLRIRWVLCACLLLCLGISAVLIWNREELFGKRENSRGPNGIVGQSTMELSGFVTPDGADRLSESYQTFEQSQDLPRLNSHENMADEPVAPSTSDSEDCHTVTFGDDAVLNCPLVHVLNLTVTSNNGYESLDTFLAQFPKLEILKLDFASFCPQPPSSEDRENSQIVSLTSLKKLTILNSKNCENLSSTFTFKMPGLVHLRFVNTRLDLELNKKLLNLLDEACQPKPQGTLNFVDIWHSDVCSECGFEFDECEAEPSSSYNYVKYFK